VGTRNGRPYLVAASCALSIIPGFRRTEVETFRRRYLKNQRGREETEVIIGIYAKKRSRREGEMKGGEGRRGVGEVLVQ